MHSSTWNNLSTDETFIGSAWFSTDCLVWPSYLILVWFPDRVLEPDHQCSEHLFQTRLLHSLPDVLHDSIMQEQQPFIVGVQSTCLLLHIFCVHMQQIDLYTLEPGRISPYEYSAGTALGN